MSRARSDLGVREDGQHPGVRTSVCAAILAYNRVGTLKRCLAAVLQQTLPLAGILVFDNGSTDETPTYLAEIAAACPIIRVARVEQNLNAAAGMGRLMELALETGADWVWTMDDDIVPASDAVAKLLAAWDAHFDRLEEVGFLVSYAVTPDGKPTGMPQVDQTPSDELPPWAVYLADGMVRVRTATLSSALIPSTTFRDFGGVNVDFTIYGEDTDFALRVGQERPCYLVGASTVTHLMAHPGPLSIVHEKTSGRLERYWFLYRNTVYLRRTFWPPEAVVLFVGRVLVEAAQSLASRPDGLRRASIAVRGLLAGFVFRPSPNSLVPAPSRDRPQMPAGERRSIDRAC
jgi:GT2 family glycosyltransferase